MLSHLVHIKSLHRNIDKYLLIKHQNCVTDITWSLYRPDIDHGTRRNQTVGFNMQFNTVSMGNSQRNALPRLLGVGSRWIFPNSGRRNRAILVPELTLNLFQSHWPVVMYCTFLPLHSKIRSCLSNLSPTSISQPSQEYIMQPERHSHNNTNTSATESTMTYLPQFSTSTTLRNNHCEHLHLLISLLHRKRKKTLPMLGLVFCRHLSFAHPPSQSITLFYPHSLIPYTQYHS